MVVDNSEHLNHDAVKEYVENEFKELNDSVDNIVWKFTPILVHYYQIVDAFNKFDHNTLIEILETNGWYNEFDLRTLINTIANKELYNPIKFSDL